MTGVRRTEAVNHRQGTEVRDRHQEARQRAVHIQEAHPAQGVPGRAADLIKEAPVRDLPEVPVQNHPEAPAARAAVRAQGKESKIKLELY